MSAIVPASADLVADVSRLVAAINEATADEAKAAHGRLGMAREWAKLQENAAELAERLIWLEAVILRRIGQLDPKVLAGAHRPAARHFANLDDADLSRLLADYPGRTAITSYNLYARAQRIDSARTRGRRIGAGELPPEPLDECDNLPLVDLIALRNMTVRQAAAVLVDEYGQRSRSVSSVVDEFIADERPVPFNADPIEVSAFRRGLAEAVREAFRNAPVETTERSDSIPAYITVLDGATDEWLRIPSEFATVAHARQMLEQRRAQVEHMRRALDRLERVLVGRFRIDEADPSDWLRDDATALAARLRRRDDEPHVAEARTLNLGAL